MTERLDALRGVLERVYAECHRVSLIDPDPLLVVREYPELPDRELVALLCASLALGRARSIVNACHRVLAPLGPHPAAVLASTPPRDLLRLLGPFSHRFFDGRDAVSLLCGASSLARGSGSLEGSFAGGGEGEPLLQRCDVFVDRLRAAASRAAAACGAGDAPLARNLLPAPRDGSACKRLMLFLRWMVRSDGVDPGGWTSIHPRELILPLDVHLHRISRALGLTSRKVPDLRAAVEATETLRLVDAEDPVRFDFALARLGIHSDYSLNSLLSP